MARKQQGYGVVVEYVPSDGVSRFLRQCKTVKPTPETTDEINVDTHDNSTNDEELIPAAIVKNGEMKVSAIFDPLDFTQQAGARSLRAMQRTAELATFKIHYPGISPPYGETLRGFVKGIDVGEFNTGDAQMIEFTIRQTAGKTIGYLA